MPSLIATLGLDKTGFDAGMAAAGKQVNRFGANMKTALAGAFGAAAVTALARQITEAASKIADIGQKLGVGAERLQELEHAAKQTGATVEDVAAAFRGLSKARLEALGDPKSKAGQVFSAMGIDAAALKSQALEETFAQIAETIRSTDFGASELAMVETILGRAGGELIPMFKAGIEAAAKEARNLGLIMSEDVVAKIDDAGDAMDRLAARFRTRMAPVLSFVADRLRDIFDAGDVLFGNAAAIGKTLSSGGTLAEARQAGREHVFAVIARREREDAVAAAKSERRKAGQPEPEAERAARAFEFKPVEKVEIEKVKRGLQIQETAFGRIGAFTGAAATASLPPGQAQQIQKLEKMIDLMSRSGILVKDVR